MYAQKIHNYEGDCRIILGSKHMFSEFLKEFAAEQTGHGLDVGAGPRGVNGIFFVKSDSLDGCDAEQQVVDSFSEKYNHRFRYFLGSQEPLPYGDGSKDFVVCSCVIQHLKSFQELGRGISEMARVLKSNGNFYLMFKAGSNDTILSHYNKHYNEMREFRVFEPSNVKKLCSEFELQVVSQSLALDNNWIPYCCLIMKKK